MKSVMQHPVVFLDKYLDSDLCDFIVKEGKKLEVSEGAVYEKKTSNKHQDDSIRKRIQHFLKKVIG